MTIEIVAVDDHPIVVEGLVSLLSRADASFHLARATAGWPELDRVLEQEALAPDLALVDLHRDDGTEPEAAVLGLVARGIPVVVLTSELRPVPIRRAVEAGATGLALKSDPVDQILEVLRGALAGEFHCVRARVGPPDPRQVGAAGDRGPVAARRRLATEVRGAHMQPPVSTSTVITYINRAVERYRELGRDVGTSADAIREATADGFLDTPQRVPSKDD